MSRRTRRITLGGVSVRRPARTGQPGGNHPEKGDNNPSHLEHNRETAPDKERSTLALAQFIASYAATNMNVVTRAISWRASFGLQEVNGYNVIKTGLILTPGTIGILAASVAGRFARRHPRRWLIIAGFLVTAVGMILLLALVRADIWRWIPGLFLSAPGSGPC